MLPKNRISTHPGEILKEEFLKPLEITQKFLADSLNISVQRINELINGKRGITPDSAWLFSRFFDTTPEFWMNLQVSYELTIKKPENQLKKIKPFSRLATIS